jgi:hypothetical protein
MSTPRIELDWTRLLGFSQATPGAGTLAHSPKIGPKEARGFDNLSAAGQPAEAGNALPVAGKVPHAMVGLKPSDIGIALQAKVGLKPSGIGSALQAKVGSKPLP